MRTIIFTIGLFIFWILLSGYFSPLLLSLGAGSILLVLYLSRRMNVIDHESYPLHLSTKLPAFLVYLWVEIIKANIDVVKRIIKPGKLDISPQTVDVPLPQKTDLGKVIYANAITLTPGTVSVEMNNDRIVVHALSKEGAEEILSGEMAKSIPEKEVTK